MYIKNIKNKKFIYRKFDLIWYFLIFILIIFIDQITKYIAKVNFSNSYSILFLKFLPLINHGIAFGFFSNSYFLNQYLLAFVSLTFLSYIFYLSYKKYNLDHPIFLETFIISGSISNILDRFIYGGVIDFLGLNIIDSYFFPIGNIADIIILISIIILIFILSNKKCYYCKEYLKINELYNKQFIGECCWKKLNKTIPIIFYYKKKKIKLFSLGFYSGFLKKILYAKYYKNNLIYKLIGEKMADYIKEYDLKIDYLIPIPKHIIRRINRGFNQTEEIANSIGNKLKIKILNSIFFKEYKEEQSKIEKEKKLEQNDDIFYLFNQYEKFNKKNICIIDDIYTTGYTIKCALDVLEKTEYEECIIFVAARCYQ